jgi:ankyrin repeat protein
MSFGLFSRFKYWINILIFSLLLIPSWSQAEPDYGLAQELQAVTALRLGSLIEKLLIQGADPCLRSLDLNALDKAAGAGDIQGLRTLLAYAKTCNIHSSNIRGENLVFRAVQYGQTDMLRFLLTQGVNPNQKTIPGNYSALHLASTAMHVNLLLDHGADLEARGTNGCSPLNSTLANGLVSSSTQLILRGADVNVLCKPGFYNKRPEYFPLSQAIGMNSPTLVKLILEHGANPFATHYNFSHFLTLPADTGTSEQQEIKKLMREYLTIRKIP